MHIDRDHPASTRQPEQITTGVVWSEVLAETTRPPVLVNRAHFAPGARTCWHEHPHGQILIVESGVALVQQRGEEVVAVEQGGRVVCEPGVEHWHGAAPEHGMTQLAITGSDATGNYAVWGELVSDDEYGSHARPDAQQGHRSPE